MTMSAQPVASERAAAPRARAWPWVPLSYLAVGLVALLPRVLGLGVFLSGDESEFWLRRSQIFLDALRAHDWLATAPFVVAFSRVLHTDALAASFITLSLLAACLYWHHGRRARWLIGSGVAAGLAILSKSPSLALLPWVGLVALAGQRSSVQTFK